MTRTQIMVEAFGHGRNLSDVTLAEIEDAFVHAGYSLENAEDAARDFDGAILPPKVRVRR